MHLLWIGVTLTCCFMILEGIIERVKIVFVHYTDRSRLDPGLRQPS